LSPLALGVLKYSYLASPLLLVEIFIDFGYTIGLIFGVSSMHRRSSGAPSGGVSFGNLSFTAGDLPPTGYASSLPQGGVASIKTALTSVGPIDREETTGVWFEIEHVYGRPRGRD
jgi:hypothetical protein